MDKSFLLTNAVFWSHSYRIESQQRVYGAAPSPVILRIAINYILGFDPELRDASPNFKLLDTIKAKKKGKLQDLLNKAF